jgi:hypothetical protein
MSGYDDIGLDENLRAKRRPGGDRTKYTTGFSVDANFDRNAITDTQIRNLNFGKGQGGTLTLGGAGNGNGVLQIKDSNGNVIVEGDNGGIDVNNTSGSTIVRLDSSGITVNSGSITINNAGGTNIIDSQGLVSSTNFGVQTSTITGGTTTDDYTISYDPVPGGTIPLPRTRTTTYMIGMSVNCRNTAAHDGESVLFKFDINGVQFGPDVLQGGLPDISGAIVTNQMASAMFITALPVGTSNLVLMFATSGAGSAQISDLNLNQLFAIRLGN